MSVHQFTIDSDNLFPNRKVDLVRFTHEIRSGIAATLTSVAIVEGNCVITFVETLTDAQVLALEALVFAHAGAPLLLSSTGFTTTSTSYVDVPRAWVVLAHDRANALREPRARREGMDVQRRRTQGRR
jgi:hypothetical protein